MREFYAAKEIAKVLGGKSRMAVVKRAKRESWPYRLETTRGGKRKLYGPIQELPPDVQVALVKAAIANGTPPLPHQVPLLCPLAQAEAVMASSLKGTGRGACPRDGSFSARANGGNGTAAAHGLPAPERAVSPKVLTDPRVAEKIRAVQEALACPADWKKRAWIEAVATKHGVTYQTLYKWIKKFETRGPEALANRKRRGISVWDEEALSYWVGLCLKNAHRRLSRKALYDALKAEAKRRGWRIGSYHSARWHLEREVAKYGKEALLAFRDGGLRALDYVLTPVLRSYADLEPFEILVGDQHRFDFWVVDDETGRVFRPEGYLWQDLRTRLIFGGALSGEHYDTQTMLLALGIGCRIFGLPKAIYTDHGKPEESRTMSSVIRELSALAVSIETTSDLPAAEEETLLAQDPRTHRKAIVRNAKAKMIERTFQELERIMVDVLRLPGYVKKLTGSKEAQEIDQAEAERLAREGRLPTYFEFCAAFYKALDYYNREKPHRGVHREWPFSPKPSEAKCTPLAYLAACMAQEGFRPRYADEAILATIFLFREKRLRKVNRGLVRFRNHLYTHDDLLRLSGQWVEVRYDPYDPGWILVFHRGKFVCRAEAVEYSSMKDTELASRKLREKYEKRRFFLDLYRELTRGIPDLRQFSAVPKKERPKAVFGKPKEEVPAISEEEFQRQLAELSVEPAKPEPQIDEEAFQRELAERAAMQKETGPVFVYKSDRYMYLLERLAKGEAISAEDEAFMAEFEGEMDQAESSYWDDYCRVMFNRSREEIKAGAVGTPAQNIGGGESCVMSS